MGRLKPGAEYIYEKADGIIYAREPGQDIRDRFEIGRDYKRTQFDEELKHTLVWKDIFKEAKTNPALQKAIDNVIIVYNIIKTGHE